MNAILGSTPTYDEPAALPIAKPATLGEAYGSMRVLARGDRMDAEAERLRRGYEPVLAEINADRAKRGLSPFYNPGRWVDEDLERGSSTKDGFLSELGNELSGRRVNRRQQQAAIFAELRAIRARDKGFLADVPDDDAAFRAALIERERSDREAARGTLARSSGLGGTLAGFAGGVVETMHDPVNLFSLPLGGGGKTIVSQIGRSILVNGALELVQQPIVALHREDLGEELTLGEAAQNVGFAAVGGVIGDVGIPQAGKLAFKGADAAYRRLRPGSEIASALRNADLPDAALASRFAELVPQDVRSFDERAALHVINREAEVRGSSPYVTAPGGLDAHAARMQATIEALLEGQPAPRSGPSAAPRGGGAVPIAMPSVGMQFRAILGIEGGIDRAGNFRTSPAGAIGPAQVMPGTAPEAARLAGVPFDDVKYRTDAAYNRQLGEAYYREMLSQFDGDPVKAAAAYNAGPGSAKRGTGVRGAMAKAAAAGEPDNWVAHLPAETQAYVRNFRERTGVEPGPGREIDGDGELIARPTAMDAERTAIAGPSRVEVDAPQLRLDLFPDDASWRSAQSLADAETLGMPAAQIHELNWREALNVLRERQEGEVAGALHHPEFGPIDMKWGVPGDAAQGFKGGYGLAHIMAKHPDLELAELQSIVAGMQVSGVRSERVVFESADHQAAMALTWHEKDQQWLVTAFRKDDVNAPAGSYSTREPRSGGTVNSRPGATRTLDEAAAEGNVAPREAGPHIEPAVRDELPPPAHVDTRALDLFDDPAGEGAKGQIDSLVHDLRASIEAGDSTRAFRLEDGSEKSAAEILADLDEDAAALNTIRSCL